MESVWVGTAPRALAGAKSYEKPPSGVELNLQSNDAIVGEFKRVDDTN